MDPVWQRRFVWGVLFRARELLAVLRSRYSACQMGCKMQAQQARGPEKNDIPSQEEKIHAHSFVLEPELRIQYTYIYVNNSECHRFWIRYTHLAFFAIIFLVTDMNTHTWKTLLDNEFEFNSNTYTSKIDGNSKCTNSHADGAPPPQFLYGKHPGSHFQHSYWRAQVTSPLQPPPTPQPLASQDAAPKPRTPPPPPTEHANGN